MPTVTTPQDTLFTFDILGRYGCNTLAEALDSANPQKQPDARPFHDIVVGGGSFSAVLATRLFNLPHWDYFAIHSSTARGRISR